MEIIKRRMVARPKADDILNHWGELTEGMQFSTQEFYQRIETAIKTRQVPNLQIRRVDFKEGGLLTPRREYLRFRRERLIFDICAMPFGTGFLVTEWFWQKPLRLGLITLLLVVTISSLVMHVMPAGELVYDVWRLVGHWIGLSYYQSKWLLVVPVVAVVVLVALWLGDRLDDTLIRIPLIGYIYERWFRRITYYRVDRISAFQTAVHGTVCDVLNDIRTSQGIAPLSELARRPAHRALQAVTDSPSRRRRAELVG